MKQRVKSDFSLRLLSNPQFVLIRVLKLLIGKHAFITEQTEQTSYNRLLLLLILKHDRIFRMNFTYT